MTSTATIRTTNIKESKEKKNREKLLAGPMGSEFSLANGEDFELDYYDYNVCNAGAAPGSYLGMDPAYLVWIPPLDDGNIIKEMDDDEQDDEPHYEEILPNYGQLDPGSNTETPSPIDEERPRLPPLNGTKKQSPSTVTADNKNRKNTELSKILAASTLCSNIGASSYSIDEKYCVSPTNYRNSPATSSKTEIIQMQDFVKPKIRHQSKKYESPVRVHTTKRKITMTNTENNSVGMEEKETTVVKSPSDSTLNAENCYALDDIQFADDEDEEVASYNVGMMASSSSARDNKRIVDNTKKIKNCEKVK